jgi:mRNA interferase MazF
MIVRRNDLWLADLGDGDGSEQSGTRPVLILQNNVGNRHSPTVIIAAITDAKKGPLPTHVYIKAIDCGISKDSVILLEQIRTIDKQKLMRWVGRLPREQVIAVDKALSISLELRFWA